MNLYQTRGKAEPENRRNGELTRRQRADGGTEGEESGMRMLGLGTGRDILVISG